MRRNLDDHDSSPEQSRTPRIPAQRFSETEQAQSSTSSHRWDERPRPSTRSAILGNGGPRRRGRHPRERLLRLLIATFSLVAAGLVIAAVSLALLGRPNASQGKAGATALPTGVPPASKPPISQSPTPGAYVPQTSHLLSSIDMLSPTDGWAVGSTDQPSSDSTLLILHYTGSSWQPVPTPTNQELHGTTAELTKVVMISPSEGWAIGDFQPEGTTTLTQVVGLILHYSSGHWTKQSVTNGTLSDIFLLSASDGWAVGAVGGGGLDPGQAFLLHYNGSTWAQVQAPGPALTALAMTSASNGWAVGSTGGSDAALPKSVALQYDGSAWRQQDFPVMDEPFTLTMVSARNGWATGLKFFPQGTGKAVFAGTPSKIIIAHYDGQTWTAVPTPITTQYPDQTSIASLFMDASDDGWAVGSSSVGGTLSTLYLHYTGGHWTQVNGPGKDGLKAVFFSSASEGWAVGPKGTIMHYQNGSWTKEVGAP